MNLTHAVACFFAGLFFANTIPHFVHGVSGNRFPTPFAKPPGQGLSSSTVNVIWALVNLAAFYFVGRAGDLFLGGPAALGSAFAGGTVVSLFASVRFRTKHAS